MNSIREEIELIRQSEGEGFVIDENALNLSLHRLNDEKSGLAIKVLSIAGGFLATLSFIGFLMVAGLDDSKLGLIFTGAIFITGAIWLNIRTERLIVDTSVISVFITGFCLLAFGISQYEVDDNLIPILFGIIAALSIRLSQKYILPFISVLIFTGSILSLIVINEAFDLIHLYIAVIIFLLTYLFLNEAKIITQTRRFSVLYNPVRTGLIFSLLAGLLFVGKKGLVHITPDFVWLSSIITIPAFIYLVSIVLDIFKIYKQKNRISIYVACLLVLIPTAFSPAISGSLLIILLCFFVNYKTGFATGIIAFIYFVGQYYYDLNFSLLTKSILLVVSGVLFLIFFLFTYKKLRINEKN